MVSCDFKGKINVKVHSSAQSLPGQSQENSAPVLDAIGNQTVAENTAITTINAADGGDDSDVDGDAITYTCTYNGGTTCSTLGAFLQQILQLLGKCLKLNFRYLKAMKAQLL